MVLCYVNIVDVILIATSLKGRSGVTHKTSCDKFKDNTIHVHILIFLRNMYSLYLFESQCLECAVFTKITIIHI